MCRVFVLPFSLLFLFFFHLWFYGGWVTFSSSSQNSLPCIKLVRYGVLSFGTRLPFFSSMTKYTIVKFWWSKDW